MIKAIILRFIAAFLTTLVVVLLMPGITIQNRLIAAAVVFFVASLNAVLKIFLTQASVGCSIIALGPILLATNTIILWIVSIAQQALKAENFWGVLGKSLFNADNFWAAVWGGLIISVVSFIMALLVSDG